MGGDSGGGVDKSYNKRMATVYEKSFGIGEDYHNLYLYGNIEGEGEVGQSGSQYSLERDVIKAHQEVLPHAKDATKGFFKDAAEGVDKSRWSATASADAQAAHSAQATSLRQGMQRQGLNPASGRYQSMNRGLALESAGQQIGSMNQARQAAEKEDFGRKHAAAQMGLGSVG